MAIPTQLVCDNPLRRVQSRWQLMLPYRTAAVKIRGAVKSVGYWQWNSLWTVATGREKTFFKGHTGPVNSVAFAADGKILASGSFDNTIRLWDVAAGNNTATMKAVPEISVTVNGSSTVGVAVSANSVVFSPDGKTLAVGNGDSTAGLWDVATHRSIAVLRGHVCLATVAFSPDGKIVAVGSRTARSSCGTWPPS